MKPLRKIGVPVSELALMVSIALRFVPALMDEAESIMNAQRAPGVAFNEGGLIKRAKSYIPLLIPLFVNAIKRAIELGDAIWKLAVIVMGNIGPSSAFCNSLKLTGSRLWLSLILQLAYMLHALFKTTEEGGQSDATLQSNHCR